jgi:sigma-B regulation protein RsbU (phosphoserine phosphatase)
MVGSGGVLRIESTGLPLGMFHEVDFSATRLHVETGDMLFLYTDGLSEARCADDEYGVDRVTRVVRQAAAKRPAELVAACLSDLRTFVDGPPLDDLTLLSIQRMG